MKKKERPDPALSAHYRTINGIAEDIVRRCFWKEINQKYPEGFDKPAMEEQLEKIITEGLVVWEKKRAEEEKMRRALEKAEKINNLLNAKYKGLLSRYAAETGLLLEHYLVSYLSPDEIPDIVMVCRYPERRRPKVSFFQLFRDCKSEEVIPKTIEAFQSLLPYAEEDLLQLKERARALGVFVSIQRHINMLLKDYHRQQSTNF